MESPRPAAGPPASPAASAASLPPRPGSPPGVRGSDRDDLASWIAELPDPLRRIGETPLIDLTDLTGDPAVRLLAKAEFANPGGSVKDRPALNIVRHALQDGHLIAHPGSRPDPQLPRLLDATSGNTGIAYAMIGAALGIGVTLCLPRNASVERRRLLTAYGAELELTDPLEGSDGAIRRAREMAAESPDSWFYADQYSNDANWRAHLATTGPEIWRQTNGTVTHFVAGLGTSGTFVGTTRALKGFSERVTCLASQPDGPLHGLEGMKHMETALVPAIYRPELADEQLTVSTEEAYDTVRMLARRRGLALGISAASNVAVALRVARRCVDAGEGATIVTVLCDDAMKYLSDPLWDEEPT